MTQRTRPSIHHCAPRGGLHTASAALAVVTCGALAEVPADTAARVLLFPMGDVRTRDGRRYRLDDAAHAAQVISASRAHAGSRQIPVDYDHQLVYGVGAAGPGKAGGGQAPAAGWIDPASLVADSAGIWGQVAWTETAAARLRGREYRYVSPSFAAGKDGRLSKIVHLSLVNDPAIDELPAVAADLNAATLDVASTQETPHMDKIALALGLPADATIDAILAAIARMGGAAPASMATAASALGLAADATADQIFTAAAAAATAASGTPDPAKYVPVAALTEATARLAVLETERHDRILTAAAEAGKISPALRSWAADFLKKDEAGFTAWLAAAPAIITAGAALNGQPAAPENAHGLTADELQTAANLGLTAEAFATAKKG